jgi:SAM-dependent methyltransferase
MRRIVAAWRRGGWRRATQTLLSRWADLRAERRAGTDTSGLIPIETLMADWDGCHDYFPTAYRELDAVLRWLRPGPGDVFLDLGAGKGRALMIAAAFPFRRLVGVEISPALCAEAERNLAALSARQPCPPVEMVAADAAGFAIPDDATLLYLYNPFHGSRLETVFRAIAASLEAAPREIAIVYNNPVHFEKIEHLFPWLRRARVLEMEYRWIVYRAGAAVPGRPCTSGARAVSIP